MKPLMATHNVTSINAQAADDELGTAIVGNKTRKWAIANGFVFVTNKLCNNTILNVYTCVCLCGRLADTNNTQWAS